MAIGIEKVQFQTCQGVKEIRLSDQLDKKGQRQGEVYNESKVSGFDRWVGSSATH